MKKTKGSPFAVVMTIVLLSMLAAGCGSSGSTGSSGSSEKAAPEEKVIFENDAAKVVLKEVGEIPQDQKDAEEKRPQAGIVLEVTNTGEKEIIIDLRDLKVGEEAVRRALLEGDVVAPGNTLTFRYGLMEEEPDKEKKSDPEEGVPIDPAAVLEKGLSGAIHVVDIDGEIGSADFSTAE